MRCPIVTWRKLKIISVVATALAFIATLAVARAVRSSANSEANRAQAAPPHLQHNFACPPAHFLLGLRDRCKYLSHEHGPPPDAPNADDNLSFRSRKPLRLQSI